MSGAKPINYPHFLHRTACAMCHKGADVSSDAFKSMFEPRPHVLPLAQGCEALYSVSLFLSLISATQSLPVVLPESRLFKGTWDRMPHM